MGQGPTLRIVDLLKLYALGGQTVRAVDGLSLEIPAGQFVAVVGRSGSGKSTLLNLIAGIDEPDGGEIWIGERSLRGLNDDARTRLRRETLGLVYQFFNLLPTLSVIENVALPALLAGRREAEVMARAARLLEDVDLTGRRAARPATLSGGEMQRAALARALIHEPAIVLADEPTGNLDSRSAAQVLELLDDLARRRGVTVVLVTHSREAAQGSDRIVTLRDGRIVSDEAVAPADARGVEPVPEPRTGGAG